MHFLKHSSPDIYPDACYVTGMFIPALPAILHRFLCLHSRKARPKGRGQATSLLASPHTAWCWGHSALMRSRTPMYKDTTCISQVASALTNELPTARVRQQHCLVLQRKKKRYLVALERAWDRRCREEESQGQMSCCALGWLLVASWAADSW